MEIRNADLLNRNGCALDSIFRIHHIRERFPVCRRHFKIGIVATLD